MDAAGQLHHRLGRHRTAGQLLQRHLHAAVRFRRLAEQHGRRDGEHGRHDAARQSLRRDERRRAYAGHVGRERRRRLWHALRRDRHRVDARNAHQRSAPGFRRVDGLLRCRRQLRHLVYRGSTRAIRITPDCLPTTSICWNAAWTCSSRLRRLGSRCTYFRLRRCSAVDSRQQRPTGPSSLRSGPTTRSTGRSPWTPTAT